LWFGKMGGKRVHFRGAYQLLHELAGGEKRQ